MHFLGTVQDITERKSTEEALHQYKHIVSSSTDMLALLDKQFNYLGANEVYTEAFNLTPEQLIGKTVTEVFGKDFFDNVIRPNAERCMTGEKISYQDWFDFPAYRRYMEINYYPYYNEDNKIMGFVVNGRNITERKNHEIQAQESQKKYQALVETTSDFIWEMNLNGVYTYCSPQMEKLWGLKPEEMLGKTPFDLVPPEDRDQAIKAFSASSESSSPFRNMEVRSFDGTGRIRFLEISGVSFFDETGKKCGYRGITRDISERKQLEEQLQVRQRMDSLGTLAAGIGHDFNNLLAGILGYAGLLRAEEGLTDKHIEYADEILKSGQRAADLVARIQSLSRGSISEKTSVDICELTEDVFGILSQTTDRLIEKHISLEHETYYVHGSYDELHQVFLNLGTNAASALEERGLRAKDYIRVRANEFDAGKSNRASLPEGKYIHIFFEDNGKGMSDETRKQAFDPLFTTRGGSQRGTGLGLAMVYQIVTANHKGYIDIQSSEGHGTTVHMYLPKAEAKGQAQVKEEIDFAEGTGTVLVIEDELSLANLAKKILERQGYDVLTAVDGQDGLDKYAANKESIDLVLLDLTMPKMGGSTVLEKITEMDPEARVIICSGQSDEDIAKLSGVMGYLRKPYRINDLLQTVNSILNPT